MRLARAVSSFKCGETAAAGLDEMEAIWDQEKWNRTYRQLF